MAKKNSETILLPLIPLKEIVIFPFSVTPLYIMRPKSMQALDAALETDKRVFLLTQRDGQVEDPLRKDLYHAGTAAEILQVIRLQDGSAKVLVEGHYVGRVLGITDMDGMMQAEVCAQQVRAERGKKVQALMRTVLNQFERYITLSDRMPDDVVVNLRDINDPLHIAHAVTNICGFKVDQKQAILEIESVTDKLFQISQLLDGENELLGLENKILSQVKSSISRSQREFFLNEQLKIIEKELGMSGEDDLELEELGDQIDKLPLPDEVREKADKELGRLAKMQPYSPEATVSRTYIEWLVELPWGKYTEDKQDIDKAQAILDRDHFGLDKPKERIVEHLAVHRLAENMKSPILCFVGPPGVGKTSLARSVATALGRNFARVSLGGVRDEAEIRGHRRTYIGSLPGKIIQMIKKAGSMNPLLLLDEIDKLASDFRGDPASALLEVLDPEQNNAFNDHYLEIDFDLSRVMFITTANTTDGIPHALKDRMEIIRLPGYTEDEKAAIGQNFLVPKQIKENGLTKSNLGISKAMMDLIINGYTREAGVRSLERMIAKLCRKTAKSIVESNSRRKKIKLTQKVLREFLGPQKFHDMEIQRTGSEVGVATGLAWTEVGGEILPTETMIMDGKGTLMLTGMMGDVMQESAKAALSYIRANSDDFKLSKNFYKETDIHVHIPEGAIPKDGPSAGVTMTTSMVSALSKLPVRQDLAMTGEITLRGKVLKIGGLKEKVLAAHRNHINTIIIPKDNVDELEEIAQPVRDDIEFIMVDSIAQVLDVALIDQSKKPIKPRRSRTAKLKVPAIGTKTTRAKKR